MSKKIRTLYAFLFSILTFYVYTEKINVTEIKLNKLKHVLNLDEKQVDEIRNVLIELKEKEESYLIMRESGNQETIESQIEFKKNKKNILDKKIEDILNTKQLEKYRALQERKVEKIKYVELLKDELLLNDAQAKEIIKIVKAFNKKNISIKTSSNKSFLLQQIISDLEIEILSILSKEQAHKYNRIKYDLRKDLTQENISPSNNDPYKNGRDPLNLYF